MPAYTGTAVNNFAMNLAYSGVSSNPGAVSENIPVIADGTTQYKMTAVFSSSATWASGVTITLTYYNAAGSLLSTVTNTQTSMTAGTVYTLSTTAGTATTNAAYATLMLQFLGTPPASTTVLSVYSAQLININNTSLDIELNQNSAFANGTQPWAPVNSSYMTWLHNSLNLSTASQTVYDSLVIGNVIELMGGPAGVPSPIPEHGGGTTATAVTFKLLAPPSTNSQGFGYQISYDLSAPQPTSDVVETLLLDGEKPFGYRASNRTITLPVEIQAPTQALVAAGREYLISLVDQQTFSLTWTPAGSGAPLSFDCFRANPTQVVYGFNYNRDPAVTPGSAGMAYGILTLSFQALPYGKSSRDGTQDLAFSTPILSGKLCPAPAVIDSFTSVAAGNGTLWTLDTRWSNGLGTAVHYVPQRPLYDPFFAAQYSNTGLNVNTHNLKSLQFWFGQAYDTYFAADPAFVSNVLFRVTLTDSNGRTLSFSATHNKLPWSATASNPSWKRVTIPIPQGKSFNYASVTGYSITFSNHVSHGIYAYLYMQAWLSGLQAVPDTVTTAPGATPRGNVYNLFGLPGTARSPISLQAQLPAANPVVQEFTKSGSWKVPAGVYSISAECWGGGGAGSSRPTGTFTGGGGGGGEYAAEPTITVHPGQNIPYTVGAGGTAAPQANTVVTINNPGTGHWVCPANVTSVTVECWGAGGAGGAGAGGGGGGEYSKSTLTVVPGTTYAYSIGIGGRPNTGRSSADNRSRAGGDTYFLVAPNQVYAHGGRSPLPGAAAAGSPGKGTSFGTTHFNGGYGGTSPGAAGGGGGAGAGNANHGNPGLPGSRSNNTGSGAHLTGGAGGTGTNGGGSGGAGANAPGWPVAGSAPGGGGGGGYSAGGANFKGAKGGNGQLQLTYQPNAGNAINGGTTTFGSSATTSVTVTANGGTSDPANTASGSAGGTGSTNTVHFNGGSGFPVANGVNGMSSIAQDGWVSLGTTSFTTAGGTLASGSTLSTGVSVVIIGANSNVSDMYVTDAVGNAWSFIGFLGMGASGQAMYAFVANIGAPISSGTTLTVSTATAQQYVVMWLGNTACLELNGTNLTGITGNSTAPSVTLANNDTVTSESNLVIIGNAGSATVSAWAGVDIPNGGFSSVTGGTLSMSAGAAPSPANVTSRGTLSATLSASTNWGAFSIPFALSNQLQVISNIWTTATVHAFSGTTTGAMTPRYTWAGAAGGMIVHAIMRPASSTITVTDTGGNTYTSTTPVSAGAANFLSFHYCVVTQVPGNITFTDATSQAHGFTSWYLPWATAFDSVAAANSSGTTSVTLTENNPSVPGVMSIAVVGNSNNATITGFPAGQWILLTANATHGALQFYAGATYNGGKSGASAITLSTTAGDTIGGQVVAFRSVFAGGAGGSAGGYLGPGIQGYDTGGAGYGGGGNGATGPQSQSGGNAGALPGGGGSGSLSQGNPVPGGAGGGGMVRITYQPPVKGFDNLLLHMPGYGAPDTLCPVTPIPPGDPPDGREYPVSSLVQWRNAEFNGTYAVFLSNYSWDTGASSNSSVTRRITVTITQYEYTGGPGYSVQCTRLVTPATDIVNGIISMGNVPLPVKEYDKSNTEVNFSVSVISSANGDRFQDVLFLDTTGETLLVNVPQGHPAYGLYANYFVDEPAVNRDFNAVLASQHGRDRAVSVLDSAILSGGPFFMVPGDNYLLAYSTYGAPNVAVRYNPRWFVDRTL